MAGLGWTTHQEARWLWVPPAGFSSWDLAALLDPSMQDARTAAVAAVEAAVHSLMHTQYHI